MAHALLFLHIVEMYCGGLKFSLHREIVTGYCMDLGRILRLVRSSSQGQIEITMHKSARNATS